MDYFKNIYNPFFEKFEFITHEQLIKKGNNKDYNFEYIIVKEYPFSIFNHFYEIDSDDLIIRFK